MGCESLAGHRCSRLRSRRSALPRRDADFHFEVSSRGLCLERLELQARNGVRSRTALWSRRLLRPAINEDVFLCTLFSRTMSLRRQGVRRVSEEQAAAVDIGWVWSERRRRRRGRRGGSTFLGGAAVLAVGVVAFAVAAFAGGWRRSEWRTGHRWEERDREGIEWETRDG